ncbi:hypothetical protein EVG20_g2210 [Dentipellis fragilis]|uniref:Cytochrome P450 n=1 Tax=Dentipellis fragilis TaxID=205917 RepID=A0A4Y9ZAG3_9AGAM|nr:hypothetical protein EVG20_g2210 [Dentipellis fragilis]
MALNLAGSAVDFSDWKVLATTFAALFALSRVIKLVNGLRAVNYTPGVRVPFQPLAVPGAALPTSRWNPGMSFTWSERFNFYRKWNSDAVSVVPFLAGKPVIYTNNVDVARQVVAGGVKSVWIKPESASQAMLMWGMNLIASEKETWRRHRRIMGPAFNQKTYSLVWSETACIYRDMSTTEFTDATKTKLRDTVYISAVQKYTFKLALFVISSCGFGWNFRWDEPPVNEDGSLTIQEALKIATDHTIMWLAAPKWLYKVSPVPWMRELPIAYKTLREYMNKQVAERKVEIRGGAGDERNDVFSLLVKATEDEGGKLVLDDNELIGNVFGLMFAGHETTAHTLAATLGFLGIYPDIQKEVYDEIVSVVGDREPTFEDFNQLGKVLAAFLEALRLYPAGYVMIREAIEDTALSVPNPIGEEGTHAIPVRKGVQVVVDMIGVQYNPRYFPDPNRYDPTRWYGIPAESESISAFSIGPRTCIGRKFAAIEAVCFLTLLLRDWNVEPVLKKGETGEQWRQRVMPAEINMTLGVAQVPVKLTRRK